MVTVPQSTGRRPTSAARPGGTLEKPLTPTTVKTGAARTLGRHLLQAALIATLFPLLCMVVLGLWQYHRDGQRGQAFPGAEGGAAARAVEAFLGFLVGETRETLDRIASEAAAGKVTAV